MYPHDHLFHKQAHAGRFDSRIALLFALFILVLIAPGAFAQTVQHVTNPYAGAVSYLNPDYTAEVQTAIAAQPAGSTLAKQMAVAATYPTAVWLDHIGAINGSVPTASSSITRLGLQGHINAALAQQADPTKNPSGLPIVVELVIYDLPDRDCAALASNGELSITGGDKIIDSTGTQITLTGTGLEEYENDYITPIANILQTEAGNPNIRFVLVVEDDSLPNLITNVGQAPNPPIANCVAANGGVSGNPSLTGVYAQAIEFALGTFHQLPNVYNYLDVGHHGWLGWDHNRLPATPFFVAIAKGAGSIATVDGFITNTANYGPTVEPFMTSNEMIGGQPVHAATFYHFNPFIDEASYAQQFDTELIAAGFPSTLGFLIDTSRNGWGSSSRPTAASTSTVLDTFVNATRIDGRTDMGQWCNQPNAGMGAPPTVNPGNFPNLSAFVWIKPPGESDGNYPGSVFNGVTSTGGDPNCNPTHTNALANNQPTNAVPNSPHAGTFWLPYYTMLVQNAFPAIPATTTPGFAIASTGVTLEQGTSVADSVTVSSINNFTGTVALTVSGLPAGVTASFSQTSVTGSAGTTLTLTATNTATVGPAQITIAGTSGAVTSSTTVTLNVTAEPNFTITGPASVSVAAGATANGTLTIGFVGGLTGSVSVQASNLPAGVNANFAPNSVNTSGTISVSFFAQPGTPNETGNVTITATNGQGATTITKSITIALTVGTGGGGTPGFTLASSAAALTVNAGGSATDTITVTDTGGFAGGVTLAAAGLPAGVTATFGTNPTMGSSVLTLSAPSTQAASNFTLTISGAATGAIGNPISVPVTINNNGGGGGGGGGSCHIGYTITNQWNTGFQVALSINNTGTTALTSWTLTWSFADGQTISQLWNGQEAQSGANVTVNNLNYNANIPAGGSYTAAGFTANWNGITNTIPTAFSVNGVACN